ncbi:MAG: PKD domain-containing protein [Bacteroidales bacterium]|jgi:hypothetical protein|nr:PKD domain-containing protein [Bacteroidales bacterium]
MNIRSNYFLVLLIGLIISIGGCQEDDYELGDIIVPENLDLSYSIVGESDTTIYGDGSGQVIFTASADNVISYTFNFGDGRDPKVDPDGSLTHVFTQTDTNTYHVTVYAVGTGGVTSSKTVQVTVYSSFTDDEAIELLTGGTSKTWYWAADQVGHIGLGPNFVDATNHTFSAWYNAQPFEKTCMYDAEFVFTKTDDGMTFEQTAGLSYIPGTYAADMGVTGDECYGTDVVDPYGVKNVSLSPSSSIATIDGGYRGTTMTFSDGGYMCWYVGVSDYEIIEVSDTELKVRIEEDETYAWYQILTTEKPVQ